MSERSIHPQESLEAKEEVLTRLIERIYKEEAGASQDEVTIALNKLVETKSRELGERNQQLEEVYSALGIAHRELLQAQKLESIGRLAAGVAHEINTPIQFVGDSIQFLRDGINDLLGLISGITAILEENASQPSASPILLKGLNELKAKYDMDYLAEHMPKAIERSSEGLSRVTEIVRSMKTFSYPDQKAMSQFDIIRSLQTTLSISKNEYKYFAKIETAFDEIPMIECLGGEINQVFLNLIINAAHSIEEVNSCSGELGTITVRAKNQGEYIVIEIEDTGAGIPAHIQPNIFDPFFTTKEIGKGTGQGLAISRQVIVETHHGELTFVTEVGKGTTFFVKLPIQQPAITAAPESEESV